MSQPFTVTPLDPLAIRNVLARYCEALDTKDFSLLDQVFVPDVVADYPFRSDLRGVDAVRGAIMKRLGPIKTHHSLTTQSVRFGADGATAFATTFFVGCHFGQGPHEGKVLQAFGRYDDELVLLGPQGDDEGVPGARGPWRIMKRTVGFTKRIGDEAIMTEL